MPARCSEGSGPESVVPLGYAPSSSQGLVVEVDGYATHSSPTAFERDRRKDADLSESGVRVQRFSARAQVEEGIERVLSRT
jgi:very-short-patch-repair endonuclease